MPDNIIFYFIFLNQIILISYYYPKKMLSRMTSLIEAYPPSKYPKLYPQSIDVVRKGCRNYRIMNQVILVIGIILMFLYGLLSSEYDATQKHAEGMPLFYGMLQFIPIILLEISGFKQFKLMREANSKTTRMAVLQPRRLFDFVSPVLFGFAILLFLAYVVFEFYLSDFQFTKNLLIRIITLLVCNLLFAVIIVFNLTGKKIDPHQAPKDRQRQIKFTLNSLINTSIAATIFFIVNVSMKEFDLGYLEIVANSIYFQVIGVLGIGTMLTTLRIEDIDFDGYKENTSGT